MTSGIRRRHAAFGAAATAALVAILIAAPAVSAADPTFAPAANYPTGSATGPGPAPVNTVAADFNGDGRPDIAVADFGGIGPRILLNKGNGQFGPASVSIVLSPSALQSLAAGDVNGDGRQDLIAMSAFSVYILRGNGNGTFTTIGSYPLLLGAQVQAILVDYNSDGKLDIASPTFNAIQTLRGNGNGTFSTGPRTTVPGATTLSGLAAAKHNGDTIPDLFAIDGGSATAYALRGSGTGSFSVTGTLALTGLIPEDVGAGDLNGDGIDDIAIIGSFSFTVGTALSDGQGGFTGFMPTLQAAGIGPTSLAFGDFNGDGKNDLVVSTVANVLNPSVLMFTGNGTAQPTHTGTFTVTGFPQTPAVADYNGDGRQDIAVAGPNTLSVLLNTTP